jgi:hypothetical protein
MKLILHLSFFICHLELALQGPTWVAVRGLNRQTYTGSIASIVRLASVCQHWVPTSLRQKMSMNISLKYYAVDTVRKVWTVLSGNEPMDVRNVSLLSCIEAEKQVHPVW